MARVEQAGCRALMVTVDTPEWVRRERDVRNRFHLPPGLAAVNLLPQRCKWVGRYCGDWLRAAKPVQTSVETALDLLREELDLAMVLAGCANLKAVTRDLVMRA